jgi:hypothetical protein
LTFGQGPVSQTAWYLSKVCLVDARTGEIIWMTEVRKKADVGSKGSQIALINDVMSQLPGK